MFCNQVIYNNLFESYASLILKENLTKENVKVEELEIISNHLEDFLSVCLKRSLTQSQVICALCKITSSFGLVEKFQGEERDFDSKDFPNTATAAEHSFILIEKLLVHFKDLEGSSKTEFLTNLLLLGATHSEDYFWSSEDSVSASKNFIAKLLKHTNHSNVGQLLCDDSLSPSLFKHILKRLQTESLTKEEWMKSPSCCYVFYWLLRNVKHPHLVDYFDLIFPPPFMFVSYYSIPQRVIGIKCFDHLLDNIAPTEMKLFGRQDVIYHNLHSLIYSKDLPIMTVLYPCLLKLPLLNEQEAEVTWSKFDEVFYQLMFNFEVECNIEAKRVLLRHILLFVDAKPPFKHLKYIMKIINGNLNSHISPDAECQITMLNILQSIIKSTWPRMKYHCFTILAAILHLLKDLDPTQPSSSEISNLCQTCLVFLKHSCKEKFQELTEEYVKVDSMPGVKMLKAVLSEEL